ncbi:hypothetical protein D3C86_2014910 [compost metagenome]
MQRAAALHKMKIIHQFAVGGQRLGANPGRAGPDIFRLQLGDKLACVLGKQCA